MDYPDSGLATFVLVAVCVLAVICGLPAALAALLRTRGKPLKARTLAALGGAAAAITLAACSFVLPAQLVDAADEATRIGLFLLVTCLPAWLLALGLLVVPRRKRQ